MRRSFTRRQKVLLLAVAALGLLALCCLGTYHSLENRLLTPGASKLFLDRHHNYLGEVPAGDDNFGYWRLPLTLPSQLPLPEDKNQGAQAGLARLVVATLQTEDRHFYQHAGIYWPSVLRAAYQNISELRIVSGASTVAMQVARMQRPGGRHVFNKVRESLEALLLIHNHGHDRVLRHYLTIAPYGNRIRGCSRAAQYYFAKPVADLSWLQAAYLAALPQAPGRMNPHQVWGQSRGLDRAHRILRLLNQRRYISDQALKQALHSELLLVAKPKREPAALHAVLNLGPKVQRRQQVVSTTTLDLDLQHRVSIILAENLAQLTPHGASSTAAMVVQIQRGEVLAYVGSADYFSEKSRGAIDFVQIKRSPGSALKPFIYGLALDLHGYTAATELTDTAMDFITEGGRAYLPRNIGGQFYGPMLLRQALGNSRNIPALRLLSDIGVEPTLRLLQQAGVEEISYQPGAYGLGLALGNLPVTLEELVLLYGVLAKEGHTMPLRYFIDQEVPAPKRLMSHGTAGLLRHILSDPEARYPSFGRGSSLEYHYAVASKTGTSQGYRDAWTVAMSDRLLVAVWLGTHDWSRMNQVGGLRGAAAAVAQIMEVAMPTVEPHRQAQEHFAPPRDYLTRTICSLSGRLANSHCPHTRSEYFAAGSEPMSLCPYHAKIALDRRNGLRASAACPGKFIEHRVLLDLPRHYHSWARHQKQQLAPLATSPLCGEQNQRRTVTITHPRNRVRYLWDPDTPRETATIRLAAKVQPQHEPIVWIVDGIPQAQVDYPHIYRWPIQPGEHEIRAALVNRSLQSQAVTITVVD